MTIKRQLHDGLQSMKLWLSDSQQKALLEFIDFLGTWNKHLNLTAIYDPQEMLSKHVFDSLSILPYLHGFNVLDVGTGAGLPGLVLAIALPNKHFTLVDSQNKKISFLHQAAYKLSISNVTIVKTRIEEYAPSYCFDTIVSRAFSRVGEMVEKTARLLCADGEILAMKGRNPVDELQQVPHGFSVKGTYKLHVAGLAAERHVVSLTKIQNR